ncbi:MULTISPECIES: hypothetical protein [unclassified Ruegeria]|uniref:hypothetical protein n=1 Tax=unclassified Ruegeria TaxID=2625375 RepID=UPI001487AD16|nr:MULTISPECIES: hypothetical protein [unclassified Ruegeria]
MPEKFDKADILKQLERIVTSEDFDGSARTKSFLEHLVHRELEGRGDELRGTALAMDVFGRGADFDPNVDPIVRIEAVKLRKALDYYYLTSGANDLVSIAIPKGQYRPQFEKNFAKEKTQGKSLVDGAGWPILGICAFSGSDTIRARFFRDGFPEELGLELARFAHIRVLTGYDDAPSDDTSAHFIPRCDYVLDGSVRDAQSSLRLIMQLKRASDGSILWSDRRDFDPDNMDCFDFQEQVAKKCAVKIADAYGVVATDALERFTSRATSGQSAYQALLAFHAHLRTSRSGSLQQMMNLARNATENNDSGGLAHALVALGYVEEVALGQKRLSAVLEQGKAHAEKAVALEPQCQEALFAAAIYAQMAGDSPRFERLIGAAIQANPNGALLIALAGAWLALVSDTKMGGQMVRQALDINPLLPIWTNITLCLEDVENGDYASASEKVRLIDAREHAGDWLLIAAIHGLAGEAELADDALSNFPSDQFTLDEYLSDLPYAAGVVDLIRRGTKHLASDEM